MSHLDPEFFKELLGMFKMEADEHVQTILSNLDILESDASVDKKIEVLEIVHRSAHSLKGAARTIGLVDLEPVCQSLELSFSVLKRDKVEIPPELITLFRETTQELGAVLGSIDADGVVRKDKEKVSQMVEDISSQVSSLSKS